LRCGIADGTFRLVAGYRARIRRSADGLTTDEVWREIASSIARFVTGLDGRVGPGAPIVVSFPGPLGPDARILDAPTITPGASCFPDFSEMLARQTGRRVSMLNDLSAAAWHFGETTGVERFLVVTISSGVGSKMFDRNSRKQVLDDGPYAGEIGHLVVDESGSAPPCECGGRGHLAAIASGRGIESYARRTARADPERFRVSACSRMGGTPDSLTNEAHLVPAARAGDAWALDAVRRCTRPLARMLLPVIVAATLDRVILIGGFALSLGEVYRRLLVEALDSWCDYRLLAGRLDGLVALGDEDACLLGAAAYARRLGN
jgi:glucokinase